MKKLAISLLAIAAIASAQSNTARAVYTNSDGMSIGYTNPRNYFPAPDTVDAVEGMVVNEDGSIENAHAVMQGNAYVKLGNAMDDSDWARVWGYVEGSIVDIACNNGWAVAITNTKRVLYKEDHSTTFNQIEPPKDSLGRPLELIKVDVDGNSMPWVIAMDSLGIKSVHRYRYAQSAWEKVRFGHYDVHWSYEIFPRDIACSDNGIIFVTGSLPVQYRMDNCVWAFNQSDLKNAVASHAGLSGILPGDPLPEKQWHMLGPIDVDADGVLWSKVRRVWKTASGEFRDRICIFKTQAIDADGNVDLSIDNDDLYLNDWWINDIGAQ